MKIFVSYSSEDRKPAEDIAVRLEQEDHEVYFDRSSLRPAEGYDEALRDFLGKADLMIFLISPDSISEGRYTLSELKFARERWKNPRGRILPVMARKTPMDAVPAYLQALGILEAAGSLSAEVLAEVDRLRRGRLRRQVMGGAAIAASIAVVGAAIVFFRPDPPRPEPPLPDSAGATGAATVETTDEQPGGESVPEHFEINAEPCRIRILRECEKELAQNICAAYTALQNGDLASMRASHDQNVDRAGRKSLYTRNPDPGNEPETDFLRNVTFAYKNSVGGNVEFADIGDPRSFWRETTDAALVLNAVINASGNEIPDGESSIYFGEDIPLSIPFRVEGNQWRNTRNIHVAAFAYYNAISSPDADSTRQWLDEAVARMTDVCRQ